MGRKKVRPEARRRVIRACYPCKLSKRRCDGRTPCTRCVEQARAPSCEYPSVHVASHSHVSASGPPLATPGNSTSANANLYASVLESDTRSTLLLEPHIDSDSDSTSGQDDNHHLADVAGTIPSSHMLKSSQGEMVYVGPSASLSFLEFLRACLTRHSVMPQPQGEGDGHLDNGSTAMFEADVSGNRDQDLTGLRDAKELREYAVNYTIATRGLINLFTKPELLSMMDSISVSNSSGNSDLGRQPHKPSETIAYLVVAIGAQCRCSDERDRRFSTAYSAAAQKSLALWTAAMPPSEDTITASTLMAFYMLTAYRRSMAYMHLGLAARAAHALGIHHKSSYSALRRTRYNVRGGMDADKMERRLRLWKSICILDLMVCAILGRPPATVTTTSAAVVSRRSTTNLGDNNNDTVDPNVTCHHHQATPSRPPPDACSIAFKATFRVAKMLGEIMNSGAYAYAAEDRSHGGGAAAAAASVTETQEILGRLTEWRRALPEELRRTASAFSARSLQQQQQDEDHWQQGSGGAFGSRGGRDEDDDEEEQEEEDKMMRNREVAVASMNMSCFYYFAVMLASRPLMVSSVDNMTEGRRKQPRWRQNKHRRRKRNFRVDDDYEEEEEEVAQRSATQQQLSGVCVDAALFLVETICDASKAGALLANTCFVKAWVFAAGLVLNFALLYHDSSPPPLSSPTRLSFSRPLPSDDTSYDGPDGNAAPRTAATFPPEQTIRAALVTAIDFLRKEARVSPQAQQYFLILADTQAAVEGCKAKRAARRERWRSGANSGFVGRIAGRFDGNNDVDDDTSFQQDPGHGILSSAARSRSQEGGIISDGSWFSSGLGLAGELSIEDQGEAIPNSSAINTSLAAAWYDGSGQQRQQQVPSFGDGGEDDLALAIYEEVDMFASGWADGLGLETATSNYKDEGFQYGF